MHLNILRAARFDRARGYLAVMENPETGTTVFVESHYSKELGNQSDITEGDSELCNHLFDHRREQVESKTQRRLRKGK